MVLSLSVSSSPTDVRAHGTAICFSFLLCVNFFHSSSFYLSFIIIGVVFGLSSHASNKKKFVARLRRTLCVPEHGTTPELSINAAQRAGMFSCPPRQTSFRSLKCQVRTLSGDLLLSVHNTACLDLLSTCRLHWPSTSRPASALESTSVKARASGHFAPRLPPCIARRAPKWAALNHFHILLAAVGRPQCTSCFWIQALQSLEHTCVSSSLQAHPLPQSLFIRPIWHFHLQKGPGQEFFLFLCFLQLFSKTTLQHGSRVLRAAS